jgi:MerR family transcriptional regulator, light-induced transcriptional regulator
VVESIFSSTADLLLRRLHFRREQALHASPLALSRVVEAEVIPRLHRPAARIDRAGGLPADAILQDHFDSRVPVIPSADVTEHDVVTLGETLLKQNLHYAWHQVKVKYNAGMDTERIAVEFLGPVACYLGDQWVADQCSFADVTLGTGYLHQLLRDLTTCLDKAAETPGYHHRVLLLPAPGEQHLFGLSILGESFRRRGWDVCGGPAQDRRELLQLIGREHFDVIGFSLSADRWLEDLSLDIERFRQKSRNPGLQVMVGGYAIDTQPQLVTELGADITLSDARLAPDSVLALLQQSPDR